MMTCIWRGSSHLASDPECKISNLTDLAALESKSTNGSCSIVRSIYLVGSEFKRLYF